MDATSVPWTARNIVAVMRDPIFPARSRNHMSQPGDHNPNAQPQPAPQAPYQPGYAPQQQAPKKRKKWPWIVGVVVVLLIGGIAAGNNDRAGNTPTPPAAQPAAAPAATTAAPTTEAKKTSSTIAYEVSGTAKGTRIMYTTYSGGSWSSSTAEGEKLPWTKTNEVEGTFGTGGSLIVTTGASGGEVTCKVTVDGKEAKTASASGKFASASCVGF